MELISVLLGMDDGAEDAEEALEFSPSGDADDSEILEFAPGGGEA